MGSTTPVLLPVLFAACLALNVLTKGLIGLLFPLAIIAIHLLLTRGWRGTLQRLRRLYPLPALATFLLIAAPWHILIALANPAHGYPLGLAHAGGHWHLPYPTYGNVHSWAWFYFLNEQLFRYLNLRIPHDYDTSPLPLFLGLIFIWLLPWSAFLPTALLRATRTLTPTLRTLPPPARLNLLLLLWLTLPLLFFTFSTRQEYYVLPSLPPMIILLAGYLSEQATVRVPHLRQSHRLRWGRADLPPPPLLVLGTLVSLLILLFLLRTPTPSPTTDLATLLHQNPAAYALSFGHFLDLTGPALALFRLPLALTAVAFFLGPSGSLPSSSLR